MKRLIPLVAAIAALSGCVTLRAEHALTGKPRPAYSGEVKIVMEGAPTTGQVDEIAVVNAIGAGQDSSLPVILKALQNEAASLGCNAVIRVRYGQGTNQASATGVAAWVE